MFESGESGAICLLAMNYPPERTGIAPYAGALACGFAAAGYSVTAHVAQPHYPEWRIHSGYRYWRSTERLDGALVCRRLHYVPRPPRGVRRLISELSFGIRVVAARWGSPLFVVAISPALFATALAALRISLTPRRWRPRFIVWVQDLYTLGVAETGEGGSVIQSITRWVEGATLRSADRTVVIHPKFADFVVRELGVLESNVEIVRNWTHLSPSPPLDKEVAKDRLHWPSASTVVVHTGNMGVKQGLTNVVEAARLADACGAPVHFVLVGDGGERKALEESARGVQRLSFIDPLDNKEYRYALAAADVLVVNERPGVSAMAMPSKLTAYFDAARPVVAATDPNGITAAELRAADAGIVVPADDPEALLVAVLKLREDPAAAAHFARNGRRHREAVLSQRAALDRWLSIVSAVE